MVVRLPEIEQKPGVCEGCVYGKMHRLPFPTTTWRAKSALELIHADIWGPSRTLSLRNKRYFILFVDDYIIIMWVYFLSEKSEAFSTFLKFKALVEKQSALKLRHFKLIFEENLFILLLWSTAKRMEFKDNSQFDGVLNKMV